MGKPFSSILTPLNNNVLVFLEGGDVLYLFLLEYKLDNAAAGLLNWVRQAKIA